MKRLFSSLLPALAAGSAICTSGCLLTYIDDAVSAKVYSEPSAWVPKVSDDDGNPIDVGAKIVSREMKVGDPVTGTANLSSWKVKVDGEEIPRLAVRVRGDYLVARVMKGFCIIYK